MLERSLSPEYLQSAGIVSPGALMLGDERGEWDRETLARLVQKREVFLCRLDHGRPTIVARHLWHCLAVMCCEPELSEEAQQVLDWLSENQGALYLDMRDSTGLEPEEFDEAFAELQKCMCVAPIRLFIGSGGQTARPDSLDDYLWATAEYWAAGLPKPEKYRDVAFCMTEVRQLLAPHFSTEEISRLIYQYVWV